MRREYRMGERPPSFVTKWGSQGTGDGKFVTLYGVAVDSSANVYAADFTMQRIQKFDSEGTFIIKWSSDAIVDPSLPGEFGEPTGVAVDSSNNVYVADLDLHSIQKFTSEGTVITKWGSNGEGDGEFRGPRGVAVDSSGYVYVPDELNHRIQKFDSDGTFITKWGSKGTGDGQFINPIAVAVDSSDNVYICEGADPPPSEGGNNRIQKFTSEGTFITKWGSKGDENGQFRNPLGVAVDSSNNVYVADTGNDRIQKFTSEGTFVTKWGSNGEGDGQFLAPIGVAVDSSNNVYVADGGNTRIQKFGKGVTRMAEFEIYKDQDNPQDFRWRLRANNGEIIADSGEGYNDRDDCEHGIDLVKSQAPSAQVQDLT
jgi:tripartite motif-containing protein 71